MSTEAMEREKEREIPSVNVKRFWENRKSKSARKKKTVRILVFWALDTVNKYLSNFLSKPLTFCIIILYPHFPTNTLVMVILSVIAPGLGYVLL